MIYGYCRISRKEQSIDRQVRNIIAFNPDAKIIKEAFTGTKVEGREKFEKLIKTVKAGDTIIFDSVSRMSRNSKEGIELYFGLCDAGINLVFLKERYIDTDTYKKASSQSIALTGNEIADIYIEATNKVLRVLARQQIEIAFDQAEKEVEDLHQRTAEGIETARRNGKQVGQKAGRTLAVKKEAPAKEIILKHSKTFGGDLDDASVMKLAGISHNTLAKYKKELLADQAIKSDTEAEAIKTQLQNMIAG